MDSTLSPNLHTLPPELIWEIADHLQPDGVLALKFTLPILNQTLALERWFKNKTLTSCARLAIRTYLAKPEPNPSHMRCILCKCVYPTTLFHSSSSAACVPLPFVNDDPRTEVVELPERFCAWHVGRLARIVHTESGERNRWTSARRGMCMHCGAVRGWSECDCGCDSCGTRWVRTYTRYLNNKTECRRFVFWRGPVEQEPSVPEKNKGRLFVRETCWDPDATDRTCVINLPVHFEDDVYGDPAHSLPIPSDDIN